MEEEEKYEEYLDWDEKIMKKSKKIRNKRYDEMKKKRQHILEAYKE